MYCYRFSTKVENKSTAIQNENVLRLQSTINLHQDNWIDQRFFPWPALASYCLDLIYIVYTVFLLISRPNIFPWFTKSRVAFSILISVDSKPSLNLWTTNKSWIKLNVTVLKRLGTVLNENVRKCLLGPCEHRKYIWFGKKRHETTKKLCQFHTYSLTEMVLSSNHRERTPNYFRICL